MEFKGTKGKWEIYTNEFETHNIISNGYYLGELNDIHDAKLIACAPELLQMLRKVLNNSDVPNEVFDEAKQLIKRATS